MNTATCDTVHVRSLQSTHSTQSPRWATFREHRWILKTCPHVLHHWTLYTYTEGPFAPKASWEKCPWSRHSGPALHSVKMCVCVCCWALLCSRGLTFGHEWKDIHFIFTQVFNKFTSESWNISVKSKHVCGVRIVLGK